MMKYVISNLINLSHVIKLHPTCQLSTSKNAILFQKLQKVKITFFLHWEPIKSKASRGRVNIALL